MMITSNDKPNCEWWENYKKTIIENLNDEGGEKKKKWNYWNFEGWEKENIETLKDGKRKVSNHCSKSVLYS